MKCPHAFIQRGFAWRKALPFAQNYDKCRTSVKIRSATPCVAKPEQSIEVAQRKGIQLGGRGSSSGSAVAWWLGHLWLLASHHPWRRARVSNQSCQPSQLHPARGFALLGVCLAPPACSGRAGKAVPFLLAGQPAGCCCQKGHLTLRVSSPLGLCLQ